MISRTPDNSTKTLLDKKTALQSSEDGHHDADRISGIEKWLDQLPDCWSRIVKKVSKSDALRTSSKKAVRQMCFGLGSRLVAQVEPLVGHISSGNSASRFEELVELSESICVSIESASRGRDESSSQAVFSVTTRDELPLLLPAFSSLLVAQRLRDVVLHGNDLQFERIMRSLQSLQSELHLVDDETAVLLYQWLAIELPLTIAAQLVSVKPFKKDGKRVTRRFAEVTSNLLDSDGWPGTNCLRHFGALVASWTRCVNLAKACNFKLGSSFMAQMEWVAEQFTRMHGPRKRLVFSADDSTKTQSEFAEFVMQLGDDRARKMATAAGLLSAKRKSKSKSKNKSKSKSKSRKKQSPNLLTEPTCVSEWANSAVLRSSWKPKSPIFAIDFSSVHCRVELAARESLLSGVMSLEIRDDGMPVSLGDDGFDVVCELDDEEVSYLELEIQQSGIQIFRQLLLSKKDRFLFFADSVNKKGAGEIDYRLKMPLAQNIDVVRENGTREVYLNRMGKGIQSLVLPISLPEWTVERCRGLLLPEQDAVSGKDLLCVEKSVQLQSQGGSLYSPVFIDLDPKRSRLKRTWRSLTVGENLNIVRPEVAASYRVQVDEQQWVFYRALHSIGNRTFMGQNFSGDFYAGRFFNDGSVSELVQVE